VRPTSRGRLRRLRGGEWEESRQFSQPDASLPALPALAAAAADTLSRPPVPARESKHPDLVPIEEIERGLASEGAVPAHSFPALPNLFPPPQAPVSRINRRSAVPAHSLPALPSPLPSPAPASPRDPIPVHSPQLCPVFGGAGGAGGGGVGIMGGGQRKGGRGQWRGAGGADIQRHTRGSRTGG